jgi:acetylornithine deacetylase/succinyl-diaminopimelate desuccinylase-like protein
MTASEQPFLLASRLEDSTRLTLLLYACGDTCPGPAEKWTDGRAPWRLSADDDDQRWYGSGIASTKGPLLISLTALQAVLASGGRLGCNIHILIDMGATIASPGLSEICDRIRDEVDADIAIACQGEHLPDDRPVLALGSRGCRTYLLRLKRRRGGRGTATHGGVLRNPAVELTHALASLVSASGQITVDGWTPPALPDSHHAALQGVTPAINGVDDAWGQTGLSPAERLHAWSSLDIIAMTAGKPSAPRSEIPPEARAVIQLQVAPGMDQDDLTAALREHLDRAGFQDVDLEACGDTAGARSVPVDDPAATWAMESITRTCGGEPAVLPLSAEGRAAALISNSLGIPSCTISIAQSRSRRFEPNEHITRSAITGAAEIMTGLFCDAACLARADGRDD